MPRPTKTPVRISLTWGVMPTKAQWNANYKAQRTDLGYGAGPQEEYMMGLMGNDLAIMEHVMGEPHEWIDNPRGPEEGLYEYTGNELYSVVQALLQEDEDDPDDPRAGELAGSIMESLGIEWI